MMRKVKMPVAVFYPNTPVSEAEYEITPKVMLRTADGAEYLLLCPSFTVTFPALSITTAQDLGKPDADGVYHVKANKDGVFRIEGTVGGLEDPNDIPDVLVNDVMIQIYYGGTFTADLALENGKATVYEIRAEKGNYVTAVLNIVVEP